MARNQLPDVAVNQQFDTVTKRNVVEFGYLYIVGYPCVDERRNIHGISRSGESNLDADRSHLTSYYGKISTDTLFCVDAADLKRHNYFRRIPVIQPGAGDKSDRWRYVDQPGGAQLDQITFGVFRHIATGVKTHPVQHASVGR